LQVVMYHGYCKNWMAPAVVVECDHGHDPLSYLVSNAFVGSQPWYWHVFEIRVMLVSNYFASTTFHLKL
jgi:hypothetical protein